MNIGFDAKRAFQNRTGLGNYSRTLIRSLADQFPQHRYWLFAPKVTPLFTPAADMRVVMPQDPLHRWLKSFWRSRWMAPELREQGIGLYHGLSAELPFGIHRTGVRSVVTMHDLIFERYPKQYNPIDVWTYRRKARYACHTADRVIAISQQTKQDLITYYQVPAGKIDVCYQACDPAFGYPHTTEDIAAMRERNGLPERYFLYVGSVIERKNLLRIAQAMRELRGRVDLPLVVVGDGGKYKQQVKSYLQEQGMTDRVIWLNESGRFLFQDLPAVYAGATALLYPSLFEGFGIPILEALWSHTPVITSQGSCFLETAGDAALYVDPLHSPSIADAMRRIAEDAVLAEEMKEKGWRHAQGFTVEKCAAAVMNVYEAIGNKQI
ncbi:glycosyltransferase family 4 protein [Chitinophaga lutea]